MKYSEQAKATVALIIAVVVVIVVSFLFLTVPGNRSDNHVLRTDGVTSSCFVFDDGWELISQDTFARAFRRTSVTYICRNVGTGQYAECSPVSVDCK